MGRERIRSSVPRSTSAPTAIEPRLMAQMAMIRMMNGWFQKVIMIETEGGCSSSPMFRSHRKRLSSLFAARALRISVSFSEVKKTNSQPSANRVAPESSRVPRVSWMCLRIRARNGFIDVLLLVDHVGPMELVVQAMQVLGADRDVLDRPPSPARGAGGRADPGARSRQVRSFRSRRVNSSSAGNEAGTSPANRIRSIRRLRRACMSSTCMSRPAGGSPPDPRPPRPRQDVAGEDHRLALGPRLLHQPEHVRPRRGIQGGGRLVEDQDIHGVRERQRQGQLLLHPGGVGPDLLLQIELHHPFGEGHRPLQAVAFPQVGRNPEHRQTRHRPVHPQLARQVRDQAPHLETLPPAIETEDRRVPGSGAKQAEQEPDGRGLPRAVGSEQPQNLPLPDLEAQLPQCDEPAHTSWSGPCVAIRAVRFIPPPSPNLPSRETRGVSELRIEIVRCNATAVQCQVDEPSAK